jgi:hypothetical protein
MIVIGSQAVPFAINGVHDRVTFENAWQFERFLLSNEFPLRRGSRFLCVDSCIFEL